MIKGITEKTARGLLARYGENTLAEKKKKSAFALFASQFKDILILILAVSTLFSVIIGQMTEAVTIITIMLLNAVMGFIQEFRTEKTLEALKNMTAPTARVYRNGELKRIAASSLVPSDVISLRAGDRIPADCELISGVSFKSDEAILSGESDAISKSPGGDNRLFMGASVCLGHGEARVVSTGMNTEMGRISAMLGEVVEQPTPLQKRLKSLGVFIAVSCVSCGVVVILLGVLRGEKLLEMLLTGVSLAVAAIPEGLPAIVTIVLALSVNRILSRGAIIRKLHAVETLGSATVICADKTGTITENKMTATDIYTLGKRFTVTGGGNSATGKLLFEGREVDVSQQKTVADALETAVICSVTNLSQSGDELLSDGSPTETALLVAAHKVGIRKKDLLKKYHITLENPFDSTRKMMSVGVSSSKGEKALFVKGAPDYVIKKCTKIATEGGTRPLREKDIITIKEEMKTLSSDAKRVIAIAKRTDGLEENELVFLALCGITDPPRKEVREAVKRCRMAGVRPVMITGDHALTACAVARKVGILTGDERVITGGELEGMSDADLDAAVDNAGVFARVSPKDKLRIVKAFKRRGNVVAMTGDGVNDAPAIKEADIGVAMGISGSDVAKEASSVVILDDNFATIVAAVEEGRIIYQKIKRFIRFLLTSNLGEVLTVLLAMLFHMPIVFIPIQILLINLVTDGLPSVALGMERADSGIMNRPPRSADESLFSGGLVSTILFRGTVLGLCNLLCFSLVYRLSGDLTAARSATYLTLISAQMIHVFECKFEGRKFDWSSIFSNRVLVFACFSSMAASFAVIYIPFMQNIFHTCAVRGEACLIVLGCVLLSPIFGAISNIIKKK